MHDSKSNSQESEFKLEELFFSTTDEHGKITSGNEVFTRVSGYKFEELLRQPHSIIRHSGMPRVVFRVLWDTITQGKPIAAYVKNQSKDGKHYWVLAYVSPIQGGYLSVRFKPSTELLPIVEQLYQKLREVEQSIEATPNKKKDDAISASMEILVEQLGQLNFSSYNAFIETAVTKEFCSRLTQVKKEVNLCEKYQLSQLPEVSKILSEISGKLGKILNRQAEFSGLDDCINDVTNFVSGLSLGVQRASLNLTIKSEQSEVAAAPLAVISTWLRSGALRVGSELQDLILPVKSELEKVRSGLFSVATAQLQIEMTQYFLYEMAAIDEHSRPYSTAEGLSLISVLIASARRTFAHSHEQLSALGKAIRKVNFAFANLQREVLGLGLAHVNGRVECVRMLDSSSLETILHEVMSNISQARERLIGLEKSFNTIENLMDDFFESTESSNQDYDKIQEICRAL